MGDQTQDIEDIEVKWYLYLVPDTQPTTKQNTIILTSKIKYKFACINTNQHLLKKQQMKQLLIFICIFVYKHTHWVHVVGYIRMLICIHTGHLCDDDYYDHAATVNGYFAYEAVVAVTDVVVQRYIRSWPLGQRVRAV